MPLRNRAPAGMSSRLAAGLRSAVGVVSLVIVMLAVALPQPVHADIIMTGTRDATGATGPRWAAQNYMATTTGPTTFALEWQGTGDLDIGIRVAATRQWVGSNTGADNPKSVTVDLTEGVEYRIGVWAASGSGTFAVDVDDGTGTTTTTSSTTTTSTTSTTSTTTTTIPNGEQVACGVSLGFDLCLHVEGPVLTGHADVWVTFDGPSDVFALEYSWGSTPDATGDLLTDFEAPWMWSWPTHRYADEIGYLVVRAEKPARNTGAPIAIPITLDNGNATPPQNPTDWEAVFAVRPQQGTDPVVAAVGDGGDGTVLAETVADDVHTSEAEVLLFLGDMYERGTAAEWEVNFGLASFDDPGGGTGWGRLAGYTQPTLGNHEAWNLEVWRDYWHGRPMWDAFTYAGTLFLNLNSECAAAGGCAPGSPQYQFAESVLAAATESCIVAYWHRPVLSAVSNATAMEPLWQLIADNGGDLVLNGHTHDMEMTAPLNGDLQTGRADSHMVQLVSGAGGHNLVSAQATDPRTIWQATKVAGAAYLTLVDGDEGNATAIEWEFRTATGAIVTDGGVPGTGSVDCEGGPEPDVEPPTTPGTPTGTSTTPGTIDLTWTASSDDRALEIDYLLYRNGGPTPIATISSSSSTTVAYSDSGLVGGATHTYVVVASDGTNLSPPSPASDPIRVAEGEPPGGLFEDSFASGFGQWSTVSGATLEIDTGYTAPPSARLAASSNRAFLRTTLSEATDELCLESAVNITSQDGNVSLLRLRGTNSAIARIYRKSNGALWFRADASGVHTNTGAVLPSGAWARLQLCVDVSGGSLELAIDGTPVASWNASLGTAPVAVIQIGDNGSKTWNANYDDVIASVP
jgi:hypothetical protein